MKVAALFPVGQTEGGCLAAIREILSREESLNVYLLHGLLAPGQKPPEPSEVAKSIAATDFGSRVVFRQIAPINTFDLSSAYPTARATVAHIDAEHYDRVYVGITGGANPLVASIFHSAMTYLGTEVVPVYAQAKGLETEKVFVAPDIRLAALAEQAIATARSGQIRVAAKLAERLPETGEWSFQRACLDALASWDDFDYAKARHTLRRQLRHCAAYRGHSLLSGLADTVSRLAAVADRMVKVTVAFRKIHGFARLASAPDWASRVRECGSLLVADALANAKRRFEEARYTDSVLRSYRAAECATQVRLYEIGIHPSKPAAFGEALARLAPTVDGDRNLAFRSGLDLLRNIGAVACESIAKSVQDLSQMRNNAYLEHGYVRIDQDQSKRCLRHAVTICQHLLGEDAIANSPDLNMRL
jgi:hypothetical protein